MNPHDSGTTIDDEVTVIEQSGIRNLKWTSPAVIGLLAAALGLIGNVVVAWYNDRNAREIDIAKMQSQLILQAVNSHSLQQSCQNLLFFVNTSLLKDKNNRISEECTRPLQQTYVPALAASASNAPMADDMAITVKKTEQANTELFQVAFTVPNDSNIVFNTLKIYCTQMSGMDRTQEKVFPAKYGNWKPGDRVTFSVDVPKNLANAQEGWHLTFCIGSDATCLPSPNLLTLNS
jgi:hypothetical protein